MKQSPLDIEINLLQQAKSPDTSENFARALKQIADITLPLAMDHVTESFKAGPINSRPLVAFFVPTSAFLAHTVNLQTLLRGLRQINAGIEPIVFTFGVRKEKFEKALDAEVVYFNQPTRLERWLAVQKYGLERRLDALVHVSMTEGAAFAAAIRCARRHIWWSMKWHGDIPGLDGHLDGNDPFHSGAKVEANVTWRSVYTAFPDLFTFEPSAAGVRQSIKARTVYSTMARNEKYSPAFLSAVKAVLRADPHGIYLYAARDPIPVEPEFRGRFIHQGWVQTGKFVQVPDIFLDTFPFGGGHTAFEVIAAKKPLVLMETPPSEQYFPVNLMRRAGQPVLAAKNETEYVAQALSYRTPNEWPERYHAFYQTFLRDEKRMASEVSGAILDVLADQPMPSR